MILKKGPFIRLKDAVKMRGIDGQNLEVFIDKQLPV